MRGWAANRFAMRGDPDMREQLKLPLRDRWRYAKLARSEQVISDPEEARRAQTAVRVALTATTHAFSRRQMLFIGVGLLLAGATRLRGDVDLRAVLFTFGFPLLFALAWTMNRRQEKQMRRTPELNGWDLS